MMPVPSDGLPTNLSPLAQRLRGEFHDRPTNRPLLPLRRRGCGCEVGNVYRLPSGDLLLGRRRAVVQRSATTAQARQQLVVLALDEVEEDVLVAELGCAHARRTSLPLGEVRNAVTEAAKGRRHAARPFLL